MSETAPDTTPIVQAVEIAAPVDRVFALWTDPEQLVRWWPDAATFEPRVGGEVRLAFGPGEVTGEVTRWDPPAGLGFTWRSSDSPEITTQVDVTLTDVGGGRCRVELVHSGWEGAPHLRGIHEQGWAHFLPRLRESAVT